MRTASAELAEVVRHSLARELVADVYYGSTRLLERVPVTEWTIRQDLSARIKTGVDLTITYDDDFAASYTPREATDALAAYGQQVRLYQSIRAGGFTELVQIGVFRIESSPAARDSFAKFQGRVITKGSVVQLTLLDLFHKTDRARHRMIEAAPLGGSAWGEIARLTGFQLTRNGIPDVAIPATVAYDRDRLANVEQMATLLGGTAYVTSDGSVTVIPTAAGDVVAELEIGDEGTVLEAEYSQQSEGRFNVVTVDTEDDNGVPIHGEAEISTGPLAVTGEYGEYVTELPEDRKAFIKTQQDADAAVALYLEEISAEALEIPVSCLYDPRLEIGDVVTVERMDRILTGRILTLDAARTGPMSLRLGLLDDQPL